MPSVTVNVHSESGEATAISVYGTYETASYSPSLRPGSLSGGIIGRESGQLDAAEGSFIVSGGNGITGSGPLAIADLAASPSNGIKETEGSIGGTR